LGVTAGSGFGATAGFVAMAGLDVSVGVTAVFDVGLTFVGRLVSAGAAEIAWAQLAAL
jgi:hypothetical protein